MLGHTRREASLRGLPRSAQGSPYGRSVVRRGVLELPSSFRCASRGCATRGETLSPTAANNCTTCHMPKIEIPFMHDTFTDHKIQIAKVGQPFVE